MKPGDAEKRCVLYLCFRCDMVVTVHLSNRQCEIGSEQTNTGKRFSASRSRTGQHVISTACCVSLYVDDCDNL